MIFAIVENGVVINPRVNADMALTKHWHEVPVDLAVKKGWLFNDGVFSAPVVIEPEIPVDSTPKVILENIVIIGATLVGKIWWMPINSAFTLTANVTLPNSQMMVMIEQVIRTESGDYQTVNDLRLVANITNGVVTIKGQFNNSGNYRIKAERLNLGLDEINAPFNLEFDLIEFDAYEQTA